MSANIAVTGCLLCTRGGLHREEPRFRSETHWTDGCLQQTDIRTAQGVKGSWENSCKDDWFIPAGTQKQFRKGIIYQILLLLLT